MLSVTFLSFVPVRTHGIGISKEPYARNNCKSNMVPAERSFIDFCEGHAPPFVRVGYVSLRMLVVVVVVGLAVCDVHIRGVHRDKQHFRRVQRTALRSTEYLLFLEGVFNSSRPHPRNFGTTESCVSA
jgi:hypothetical protein